MHHKRHLSENSLSAVQIWTDSCSNNTHNFNKQLQSVCMSVVHWKLMPSYLLTNNIKHNQTDTADTYWESSSFANDFSIYTTFHYSGLHTSFLTLNFRELLFFFFLCNCKLDNWHLLYCSCVWKWLCNRKLSGFPRKYLKENSCIWWIFYACMQNHLWKY